jgi:dTDP-glucose pyrophosphorylase
MNNRQIDLFLVPKEISVKEAMRQMDKAGERILFAVDAKKKLIGSLSDGDIRRWVLKEGSLTSSIDRVLKRSPVTLAEDYQMDDAKEIMLKKKLQGIPIVDKENRITQILFWEDIFDQGMAHAKGKINIPVVIMAGGKGARLDPFTRILPKPLIPIGDKAIIEIIMDRFYQYGVNEFYISINHKARMIKAYFEEINASYKIHYVEEDKPLGTAGALKFMEEKVQTDLFVSNCDIIIEADYLEILKFHKKKNYDMTMIGSFRHFTIPYGICTIENGGRLLGIKEKPEYDYLVNTGMYVMKRDTLALIPPNQHFDITDLIDKLLKNNGSIGVFPIDAKSWIDIGQWEEYHKSMRNLKMEYGVEDYEETN